MIDFAAEHESAAMNEINMIPFIDVMLVLLIVFIITVPAIKHSVTVELPRASSEEELLQPETLRLSINADGVYVLDDKDVSDEELEALFEAEGQKEKTPDLHIHGDREVRYERVAQALAWAHQAGLSKIGFVTEPVKNSGTTKAAP